MQNIPILTRLYNAIFGRKELNVPKHVAIIMDGNRRYAKRYGWLPWVGHESGAKVVEQLPNWCKDIGIEELTLYAFSIENFGRDKKEVDYLMQIFKQQFDKLLAKDDLEYRVNFIGRIQMFPADIQERMHKLMDKTADKEKYKVNFAMAYTGRAEIVDSVQKLFWEMQHCSRSPDTICEADIEKNLYLQSNPDLVIRTSGEQRTSGFLPWQAVYAELYFCKKMWPDFGKHDLELAVQDYSDRKRRFGK